MSLKTAFHRYEEWDRRYGPHFRNLWLLVISVVVLFTALNTFDTASEGKETADELAELRRESVPVANKRTDAICDALKILVENERRSQSPETLKLFGSLLENIDPAVLEAQLAEGRRQTALLDDARSRLVCTPIPQGP